MSAFLTICAIGVGNFLYQWIFGPNDWSAAFERTFFQASAIAIYVFFGSNS